VLNASSCTYICITKQERGKGIREREREGGREGEREKINLIYQASIIHGYACSKDCHIAVKQQCPVSLHSCVEQSDTTSPVPDEVVSAPKDGWESKGGHSTCIFIVLQRSIVYKYAAKYGMCFAVTDFI
jgi:hypothetical protein